MFVFVQEFALLSAFKGIILTEYRFNALPNYLILQWDKRDTVVSLHNRLS